MSSFESPVNSHPVMVVVGTFTLPVVRVERRREKERILSGLLEVPRAGHQGVRRGQRPIDLLAEDVQRPCLHFANVPLDVQAGQAVLQVAQRTQKGGEQHQQSSIAGCQ